MIDGNFLEKLDFQDPVILVCSITFLGGIIAIFASRHRRRLQRYRKVKVSMSEKDMLSIMGNNCSVSSFAGNCTIYEWTISAKSHISSYRGWTYLEEKSVTIFVRDGYVEAIKSQNI